MYEPLHSVNDWDKVAAIAESLDRNGWVGAPLVADGDQLLTGVHRYEAARVVEMPYSEIPVVDIRDVFAAAGLDWDAMHAEIGCPTVDEPDYVWLVNQLPAEIMERYGIDIQ